MSPPSTRVQAIAAQLNPRVHATRFRPKLSGSHPASYTPLNPIAFLLKSASIRPDHPGLTHPETRRVWTFAEWATRVASFAYALKARGIQPGAKVFVCCPNIPAFADALQAIPAAQCVIVPINTRLTQSEVDYLLADSESALVLVDYLSTHLFSTATVPVIVCADGTPGDPYEAFLEEGRRYDEAQGGQGWGGLEFVDDELSTFAICYTSGTTNKPKGVLYNYRSTYLAAIANAVESGLRHDSKYLWILPMFHCLGWCFPYANTMAMSTQVCMRAVGNYDQVWELFKSCGPHGGVTHYSGAPTVQLSILTHASATQVSQPVYTTIAGAAPTASLIEGLEGIGIDVTHVYGLTESYGPMTRTYFVPTSEKHIQGHAFLTADDVRIMKPIPDGDELKVTELVETAFDGVEVGEIVFRGNIVMKGYYKNEEATQKAFAGGYFHTGDLAVRYPNGSFMIQDRSKDIIISGGENISSLVVESALTAHPDIFEVAVVARDSEKWGERPHAFIVLSPGSKFHSQEEAFTRIVKEFAKGKMPGFAIPDTIELVKELEKTSTGKVSKKTLRDGLRKRDRGQ